MKKAILKITLTILALLLAPVALLSVGLCLPAQFGKTYYGVLPGMYERLCKEQGKRIVVVGGSAVAFGLQGELMEGEIEGYTVCPFGLYGAIGMKAMMDFSKAGIREGDIVILAPEQGAQSMSLYFNGEHVWKGVDGHYDMLRNIEYDDWGKMVGAYPTFLSQKYGYWSKNETPNPQGIYAASSFDENFTMIYERPYNTLPDGYDSTERVSYRTEIFSSEFAKYVNEYNQFVTKKGATLLYGFTPVNFSGVETGTSEGDVDAFYDCVNEALDCEILGNPHNYILEKDWFYDSNVHVNSAGAVLYTRQLIQDLKVFLKDDSKTEIAFPEKPVVPDEDTQTGEDGVHVALFEYEETQYGYTITALKHAGKSLQRIEIPDYYNGKKVLGFAKEVFAGNTTVQTVCIGKNIRNIQDGSFAGCTSLKEIRLSAEMRPANCTVYGGLLDGVTGVSVCVPQALVGEYINDYWWSRYGAYVKGY